MVVQFEIHHDACVGLEDIVSVDIWEVRHVLGGFDIRYLRVLQNVEGIHMLQDAVFFVLSGK